MNIQLIKNENNQGLSPIETILVNRGIKREDIPHFLNTTDNDILNPLLLKNMEDGVKMLVKHLINDDKILIQIDSDCDGYCSAAILINFLYKFFPTVVTNNISYRLHEGKEHGLILDTIPQDVKLVIAPDSSSSDYEVHQELHNRGIDVLVLDHHHSEKESEFACVINNQLCDYPTKSLSGAGIVYKFCQHFDSVANAEWSNEFLDLVALALCGDMMDQRDFETQHLIKKGLKNIQNPFFESMCKKNAYSLGTEITPIGVAFYIVPYINAVIRMGSKEEKLILFESLLDFKATELIPSTKRGCKGQMETRVEQACRNCTNIKKRQTDARDASLNVIEQKIKNENLLDNKILLIKLSEKDNVNPTIRGLIANQLMSKYQKPVMMLSLNQETLTWEGSCRGYGLNSFRDFLKSTELTQYQAGHDNALGTGILDADIEEFIEASNYMLADFDFSPCYKVDFIYNGHTDNFSQSVIDISRYKSIWGQEIGEPMVAIKNLVVTKNNLMLMSRDKNPTLKITLDNGVSLIKFKSSEEEYEQLYSDLGCVMIDIVGKCDINEWRGNITPQIKIEDYSIVDRQDYYF